MVLKYNFKTGCCSIEVHRLKGANASQCCSKLEERKGTGNRGNEPEANCGVKRHSANLGYNCALLVAAVLTTISRLTDTRP